jgi:hypothetical protein
LPRQPKAPRPTVDEQLAALDALPKDRGEKIRRLERALATGHHRVIAKVARLAEDALLYELEPALLAAYPRLLEKPLKVDPSCNGKKAIVHALVALDCNRSEFFRGCVGYRQLEPVWGGTTDTAVDVRVSAAMGLVASGYPRALVELTALLADGEAEARAGAVRAIACGNPREAELLLRYKALTGDPEPRVLGECFTALLAVAPEESLELVAGHLQHADEAVREVAALALGESRLDGVVPCLRQAWGDVLVSETLRRSLVRAAAAHRSVAAADWLAALLGEARPASARDLIEVLAVYKHDAKLADRLKGALLERGDAALAARFTELFGK